MTIIVTPIPSTIELAEPAFSMGLVNTAGAATTAISSNSTILLFDTTVPDALTFSQSGATGSASTAARRDHAHAMPADPTADISVRAYNTANISTSSGSWAPLTLDSERFDTDSMHSDSSNTERLTCNTAGKYAIFGIARHATDTTGQRMLRVLLNGTTTIAEIKFDAGASDVTEGIATLYSLSATDYVELQSFQNSGGALNIEAVPNYSPEFGMIKVLG